MPSRLSDIYKGEIKGGGNLGSAVTKSLREKIDPRQMIDQSGILPTLFPSLKAYKSTANKVKSEKISEVESIKSIENINFNTELTAKNTLRLPEMARDINVMRQNIQRLVKVMGGDKVTGADMFFKTSDEYERSLEAERERRTGKKSTTPKKVLQETPKEKAEGVNTLLSFFDPTKLTSTLTPIAKGLAAAILSPVFLASIGLAGLAYLFYKMFKSPGAFEEEESDLSKGLRQAREVGGLAGVKDEEARRKKSSAEDRAYLEVTDLEKYTEDGVVNSAMLTEMAKKSVEHAHAVERYRLEKNISEPTVFPPVPPTKAYREVVDLEKYTEDGVVNEAMLREMAKKSAEHAEAVEKYRLDKNISQRAAPTPAPVVPAAPQPPADFVPTTSGNVLRVEVDGFGQTGEEAATVPPNVVRSGTGEPVRTGTGGYVVSGESTSPTKVTQAQVPSASGLPIDYNSYVQKIGEKESGGNYKAVNTLGYLGKYQFGAMALQDMGLVKKGTTLKGLDNPSNWTIEGGKQAFLNNTQLQEDTMLRYTKQNFRTLNRIGVINKDSSPQEMAGYLAAAHLLGPGGAKQLSQGKIGADAYGTSSATYFKVGSATQGIIPGGGVALAASPSTGSTVSTASSAISDGQREMLASAPSGTTVIDNSSRTTVASAASSGRAASAYDDDLIKTLIGQVA